MYLYRKFVVYIYNVLYVYIFIKYLYVYWFINIYLIKFNFWKLVEEVNKKMDISFINL